MFIQVTGIDGSGTTSIANGLVKKNKNDVVLKTPSEEYKERQTIDNVVSKDSKVGNMLYYLSSVVYMSDYIKNHLDYKNNNVYVVRYLIDTVVSNRVSGIPINLDYNIYGNDLLIPDATIFVFSNELVRQSRISARGKSNLDLRLDSKEVRNSFMKEFNKLLDFDTTIFVDNSSYDIDETINKTYEKVLKLKSRIK